MVNISNKHNKKLIKSQEFLLQLLAHNNERDNYIVSEGVTVKGISRHLKCSIGYTYYLIIKCEREGLICRSKTKVILGYKAQDSVFLTETGLKLAKELEASIPKRWKRVK